MGYDGANTFFILNAGTKHTASPTNVRRGGGSFVIGNYQSLAFGPTNMTFDEIVYWNVDKSSFVSAIYNGGNGLPFGSYT